jgi:hypothetical protein
MRGLGIGSVVVGAAAIGAAFLPAVFSHPYASLLVGVGVCLVGAGVILVRRPQLHLK